MFKQLDALSELTQSLRLREHFFKLRLDGKPIEVAKRRPSTIEGCYGCDEKDYLLYVTFDTFADHFNMIFKDELFRLQENQTAELMLSWADSPMFGPAYEVHYANMQIGKVSIYSDPLGDMFGSGLECEIDYAAYLDFNEVCDVLTTLKDYAAFDETDRRTTVHEAMLRCVWSQLRDPSTPATLELSASGSYRNFYELVQRRTET